MSNTTLNQNQTINEQARVYLDETENEIQTSSAYFKPKPGTTYVIKMDPTARQDNTNRK